MGNTKSIRPNTTKKNDTEAEAAEKPVTSSLMDKYRQRMKLEKKEKEEKEKKYMENKENRITSYKQLIEKQWLVVLKKKNFPLVFNKETLFGEDDREFLETIKNVVYNDRKIVFIDNCNKITILKPTTSNHTYFYYYRITIWPIDATLEEIQYFYNKDQKYRELFVKI